MTRREQLNASKTAVFKVWFECDNCGEHVMSSDRFCSGCGLAFKPPTGAYLTH